MNLVKQEGKSFNKWIHLSMLTIRSSKLVQHFILVHRHCAKTVTSSLFPAVFLRSWGFLLPKIWHCGRWHFCLREAHSHHIKLGNSGNEISNWKFSSTNWQASRRSVNKVLSRWKPCSLYWMMCSLFRGISRSAHRATLMLAGICAASWVPIK